MKFYNFACSSVLPEDLKHFNHTNWQQIKKCILEIHRPEIVKEESPIFLADLEDSGFRLLQETRDVVK